MTRDHPGTGRTFGSLGGETLARQESGARLWEPPTPDLAEVLEAIGRPGVFEWSALDQRRYDIAAWLAWSGA